MRQWLQGGKKGADTGDFEDVEWTELGPHWMWGGENEEGIRLVWLWETSRMEVPLAKIRDMNMNKEGGKYNESRFDQVEHFQVEMHNSELG